MSRALNLEHLRKQAKAILKKCRDTDPQAVGRVRSQLPRLAAFSDAQIAAEIQLADIHQVLARENGFASWGELKRHDAPLERFLAAVRGGDLKTAQKELQQSPSMIEESIHAACAIGHADAVRHHLAADPELVHAQQGGWTPLVYAGGSPFHRISERHAAGIVECLTLLLERGADPNNESAMWRAIAMGNRSGTLVLYQRGAHTASVDVGERQVGFWGIPGDPTKMDKALADLFEDTELVAEMNRRIKEGAARAGSWIGKGGINSLSPKDVYAAPAYPPNQDYNVMIWELLIKRGIQPNWQDPHQDSPLHHLAAWNGDAATVELFLAHGADPNLRRADGKTPLFLAVRNGNKAVADVLCARGASRDVLRPMDELIGACRRADVQTASMIVRRYPDVLKELNVDDREVLVEAAGRNQLDVVRLMLEVGFDPATRGGSGATALHAAAWHGHVEMVRLLLKAGAPHDLRDEIFGSSPREWALHGSKHCRDAAEDYSEILGLL